LQRLLREKYINKSEAGVSLSLNSQCGKGNCSARCGDYLSEAVVSILKSEVGASLSRAWNLQHSVKSRQDATRI